MSLPITTTFNFDGYRIKEYKGVVRGIIVRSPTIAQGFIGGLNNIIGGQIPAYTEMCEQAREHAYQLLIQHAQQMGANAVVGVRYDAAEVVARAGATEVLLESVSLTEGAAGAGLFQVNGPGTQLTFQSPLNLSPGRHAVRIRVNGVEADPSWWI